MVNPAGGTFVQRLESRRIEVSPGVVGGSLDLLALDDGEVLEFDIATERTVNPPAADVRDVERMCFVYKQGRRFGETAPSYVLCKREDFPRHLVHLCPTLPDMLAAPCLALGGLQPIYDRVGIEAVLERLRKFLRDAKTGTLTVDGWEPVPFSIDHVPCLGEVVPSFFQDHAYAHLTEGSAVGIALNWEKNGKGYVNVFPESLSPDCMMQAQAFRNGECDNQRVAVPWVFLWPTTTAGEHDPIYGEWRSGADLLEGMNRIGVRHAFDATVGDLYARGMDFRCLREPQGGKALIVVLGVWRPEPIMREFFGYSENPDARRLELRAFRISQDLMKEIVSPDSRVETIVGDYPNSPELYRWVAGINAVPPVALIGYGALGSAIFNNLTRSGLSDAVVFDHDILRPHNLARHASAVEDLYQVKGDAADRLFKGLLRRMSSNFSSVRLDVTSLPTKELATTVESRLVIDASADERVRRRMDELRLESPSTIVRTEMFHDGQLGVTFVTPADGPSLADMMHMLATSAVEDAAVAAWLQHEELYPLGPDPLLAGFGCTSQTIHLPLHAVEQHASVATAAILETGLQPGIAINPTDDRFRPIGWRWLPVAPFKILVPSSEPSWSIRVSAPVMEKIAILRAAALPSETGGYLYGAWDPAARTITVTAATAPPPESVATATTLKLGPAGITGLERRLLLKTRGRIYLVGTWHSHPLGSARMSGADHQTLMKHYAADAATLSPMLLIIAAEHEVQAHLKLPA